MKDHSLCPAHFSEARYLISLQVVDPFFEILLLCEVLFSLKYHDKTSCVLVLAILLWIYGAGTESSQI